jgi:plastocyanin
METDLIDEYESSVHPFPGERKVLLGGQMRRTHDRMTITLMTLLLISLSCAGRQPQVEAMAEHGEKTIDIQASSYKFEPNNIKVNQGDTIVIHMTNISDKEHNFTLKDPEGKILKSVDLHPNTPEHLTLSFPEKGIYNFYCDKSFHPTMGMKGRIEVAGP